MPKIEKIEKDNQKSIFVGRTDFFERFNKDYEYLCEHNDEYLILNAYGVEGIGKTCLIQEIIKKKRAEKTSFSSNNKFYYLMCSFRENNEMDKFLIQLALDLSNNYGFEFPKFTVVFNVYAQNKYMGKFYPYESNHTKDGGLLEVIKDVASLFGIPSEEIHKYASKAYHFFENIDLNKVRDSYLLLDESAQYNNLISYFVEDLKENLKKIKKPLVIFLDEYEKAIDIYSGDEQNLEVNNWLFGPKGLVGKGNILWVFVGKEKLRVPWKNNEYIFFPIDDHKMENDPDSSKKKNIKDSIKKIEPLEKAYVLEILQHYNIPEKYYELIWEKSKGNPGLIKDNINKIRDGKEFLLNYNFEEIYDLDKDKWQNKNFRKLLFELALLGKWDAKTYGGLESIYDTSYEQAKTIYRNYIIEEKDFCYIKDTTKKDILQKYKDSFDMEEISLEEISNRFNTYFEGVLQHVEDDWDKYEITLNNFVDIYLHNDILKMPKNIIMKYAEALANAGRNEGYLKICEKLYYYAPKNMDFERIYVKALKTLKQYNDALEILKEILKITEKEEERNIGEIQLDIADILWHLGEKQESIDFLEKAKQYYEKNYEKDSCKCLEVQQTYYLRMIVYNIDNSGKVLEYTNMFTDITNKMASVENKNESIIQANKEIVRQNKILEENIDRIKQKHTESQMLWEEGKKEESLQIQKEVINELEEFLGETHPFVLSVKNNYALQLGNAHSMQEAKPILEEIYRTRKKVLGVNDPNTIKSQHILEEISSIEKVYVNPIEKLREKYEYALEIWEEGKKEESLQIQKEVINELEAFLGETHPFVLSVKNNYALQLRDAHFIQEAKPILEELYQIRRSILGENHRNTLKSKKIFEEIQTQEDGAVDEIEQLKEKYEYAQAIWKEGKKEESLEIQKEVLKELEEILGESHPFVLSVKNNYALMLGNAHTRLEAKPILEEIYQTRRRILGEDHPDTLKSKKCLEEIQTMSMSKKETKESEGEGENMMEQLQNKYEYSQKIWEEGKKEESLEIQKEVINELEKILGQKHPFVLSIKNNYALQLGNAHSIQEAKPILEEIYQTKKIVFGENHPETLKSKKILESL